MDRLAANIDGGETGWREDHRRARSGRGEQLEKRRFARSRLSSNEGALAARRNDLESSAKVSIELDACVYSNRRTRLPRCRECGCLAGSFGLGRSVLM